MKRKMGNRLYRSTHAKVKIDRLYVWRSKLLLLGKDRQISGICVGSLEVTIIGTETYECGNSKMARN